MNEAQNALGTIPGFGGARIIARLSDGPTNDSFEVERGGERFVLRLDKPEAARLGLDRHAEKAVCEALETAGLANTLVHFDAEAGVYVRRFVPGRSWTPQDLERRENLDRLAAVLRRLHAMPPAGQNFKPLKAAGGYARHIGTVEAGNAFGQVATAYALIEPATPALCHNDLVCGNIVEGDGLSLIDWEYAGIGDPFFDLAVVVQHHGLGDGLTAHFLEAYLGRGAEESDYLRLKSQCRFYQALLELWNLRVAPL